MASKNVREITGEDFDRVVLGSDRTVLVDFAASWCGPCQMLAPLLEGVADELKGEVEVVKIDVDAARTVVDRYDVQSVPTLMVFRGGRKVAEHVGLATRSKIVGLLRA